MGDHEENGGQGLRSAEETARASAARGDENGRRALEAGRLLFAAESRFVAGAAAMAQLPDGGLPEIAFAGRSNVGKSSLINALTGRRQLAVISVTPGRTRQINFFDLGGRLLLVDLPGYGYAAAAKSQIANWTRLVDDFLTGRATLRRVLLLIDARLGAKDADRRVMAMLDRAAVSFQAVLTKADKASPPALERVRSAVAAELAGHPAAYPRLAVTSARTGAGIAELRAALAPLTEWSAEHGPAVVGDAD